MHVFESSLPYPQLRQINKEITWLVKALRLCPQTCHSFRRKIPWYLFRAICCLRALLNVIFDFYYDLVTRLVVDDFQVAAILDIRS